MVHVIASNRVWYHHLPKKLALLTDDEFILLSDEKELTVDRLREIRPTYVFFPHWSAIIPADIYDHFECVIFHMTDLPFGRGGSPLQNLIARGIYETKISALRCEAGIDAGPVYIKQHLSLHGTAEEIYIRASQTIERMIAMILDKKPEPVPQSGEVIYFERRKPDESNVIGLKDLQSIFDHIRMLDAEGYPPAFLETEHMKFEFKRAAFQQGKIVADVTITMKGKHE